MESIAPAPAGRARSRADREPNYVVRHWRGDLSLTVSYWVNGAFIGFLGGRGLEAMNQALEAIDPPRLRITSAVQLLFILLGLACYVWSVVGIWRSAARHKERGGSGLVAGLARLFLLLGALSLGAGLVKQNLAGRVVELARIAVDRDDMGKVTTTLQPDGRTLMVEGLLGVGAAEQVRQALRDAPEVRLLRLQSGGGYLVEARAIAGEVRRLGLDTYVDTACASACTMVFLAGRSRGATPNARIGFHRPAIAGIDAEQHPSGGTMMGAYRAAGVKESFIEKVRATPHASMWFPTRDELVAGGVITRLSLGGETATDWASRGIRSLADLEADFAAVPLWQAIERRFPGTLRQAATAAWQAHERGETDDARLRVSRAVVWERTQHALHVAPDALLLRYQTLTRDKIAEARKLGEEACGRLLDGTLNVSATMPLPVVEEEKALTIAMLDAPARHDVRPTQEQIRLAARPVLSRLSPEQIRLIDAPRVKSGEAMARCDAQMAYHDEIARLPTAQRVIVLRTIYQP